MAGGYFESIWGIFTKEGVQLFDVDSMLDIKYDNSSKVSTFPTEEGSFTSYNKVRSPYKSKVRMAVGGDSTRIQDFINALDAAANNTELYDIVTPERTYLNANIEKISYARSHNKGVNMINADIELIEIRIVTSQYGSVTINAKKPAAKDKENQGKKQEGPPPLDMAYNTTEDINNWKFKGIPLPNRNPPVKP